MPEFKVIEGFQVAIQHLDTPIVSVRAIVNAGSYHDKIHGSAHFLEHLFFKGTQRRGYEEMNRLIATIGETNAYTDLDHTTFYIDTIPDNTLKALELLGEMLFMPALDETEMEKERAVIIEEWQTSQDDPASYFINGSTKWFLGETLGHSGLGTKETIQNIVLDDLKMFRESHYTTDNILIALVGNTTNITGEDLAKILKQYRDCSYHGDSHKVNLVEAQFGSWDKPERHIIGHNSSQAWLGLWLPGFPISQSYGTHFSDDIAFNLLGGGMHSLLFDRLREKLGLCYNTAIFHIGSWDNSFGCAYAILDKKNVQRALDEMKVVIQEVAEGEFSEDLLTTSISNQLFSIARGAQTASGWGRHFLDHYFYFREALSSDMGKWGHKLIQDHIQSCKVEDMRDLVQKCAQSMMEKAAVTMMNVEE